MRNTVLSLRRIRNDLRQGENIDLYLTIAAAVAFVALNLAGVASTALLAPLTLAVLALWAAGAEWSCEEGTP